MSVIYLGNSDPDDDFKIEYPYPEIGDRMISTSGVNVFHTASIVGNWIVYAESYKGAADILVNQYQGYAHEDALVCPVLYLYRHYLELTLKYTARYLSSLSPDPLPSGMMEKHDLAQLWAYVENNLKHTHNRFNPAVVKTVGDCIIELSKLDPSSMAFRYSHDKKDNQHSLPSHIAPQNLKQVIAKLHNFFSEIDIAVEHRQEWIAEMHSW